MGVNTETAKMDNLSIVAEGFTAVEAKAIRVKIETALLTLEDNDDMDISGSLKLIKKSHLAIDKNGSIALTDTMLSDLNLNALQHEVAVEVVHHKDGEIVYKLTRVNKVGSEGR